MIRLRALGQCVFEVGENYVTPDSDVLFALLLILSSSAGQAIPRDDLLELLWPRSTRESARHRLRQALYQLRKLGAPLKTPPSGVVNLRESDVEIDYIACSRDRQTLTSSVSETSRLEILPHYAPTFSEPFAKWVESERDRVRAFVRRQLLEMLTERRTRGIHEDVIVLARACLDLDPLNGEATFALAETLALRGSRAEALAVLDQYNEEATNVPADMVQPTSALRRRIVQAGKRATRESAQTPELVGRADLVQEITAWLSLPSESTRVLALSGEPGIGKTRLLHEATRIASVRGMRVVEYRPSANGEEHAVAGLLDLLPQFLSLPGAVGCNPDSYSRLTALARGVNAESTIPENTSDSAIRFATLRRSVLDLVEAVLSESSVLLSIDDAHALDRPTMEILLDATQCRGDRVALIVGMRLSGSTAALLESRRGVRLIRVPGLDAASARQIVSRSIPVELTTQRARLIDWAVDLAHGNPFFLAELSTHCGGDNPGQSLPASLQVAIERKIDTLSPTARLIVQACAILSRNTTLSRLEVVLALPPHSTLTALHELDCAGLIASRDGRFGCRHDLIAEAVVRGLGASAAEYLHRRCAIALDEELKSSPVASLAWDCARHWRAAGEDVRALELTSLIADQLLSLGLPEAAAELSVNAITYCRSSEQRGSHLLRLSRARKLLHDWDGVIACLTERQAVVPNTGCEPPYGEAEITLFEARWWRTLDMQVLRSGVERVLDARAPTLHRLQMAVVALVVADNFSRRRVSRRLAGVVESLEARTPREHVAKTTARLIHHSGFGDLDAAVEAGKELVALSRSDGNLASLLRALRWASVPLKRSGKVDEALSFLTEAHAHALRLGLEAEVWNAAYYVGHLALDLEDFDLAYQWRRIFEITSASGRDPMRAMNSAYFCARLALMEENLPLATAYTTHCRDLADRLGHSPAVTLSLLGLELALHLETSSAAASDRVLRRLHRVHRITRTMPQDFEVGVLATAFERAERRSDAVRLCDEYLNERRSRLRLHSRLLAAIAGVARKP